MKSNLKTIAALLASALIFVACEEDTPPPPPPPTGNILVTQNITTNTEWTNDRVYELAGRITVTAGATLTIEEGTVIKGQAGTGANATALLIARGGKLMAMGTAALPIIFTTVADEITPADLVAGNFASPNLDPNINGLWGGIIVLGHARISASNANGDVNQVQIEGIPTSDPNGLYGGNNDADNSGVIKYISIRHGGTNIGSGNEINGLTLGGVGNGTVIEHVEVVANQDDGIEWFGGAVNVSNAVVWNAGDDAIDTDQSWSGTLDNYVVIGAGNHLHELDGPEGSFVATHTLKNGSCIATWDGDACDDIINVDANTPVNMMNVYFTEITATSQRLNRVNAPDATFQNVVFNVAPASLADYINGTPIPAGISAGTTPYANISVLSWTWASQAGAFSGL